MASIIQPFSFSFGEKPVRKTSEEFMFGSEPIIGYRAWKVGRPSPDSMRDFLRLLADAHDAGAENPYRWALEQTERTLLLSLNPSFAWLPDVSEARCNVHGHAAPDLQCECGFWALRSDEELVPIFDGPYYQPDAWGTVKIWGRFCEFTKGYRAQFAYPHEVTLLKRDEALAHLLAETYGCLVRVGDLPQAVLDERKKKAEALEIDLSQYINTFKLSIPPLQVPGQKRWWKR